MGTVTKAKIGKEDLEIASTTAYPTTFTRVTSTGGSQTLTEFPDIWKTHRSTLNAMYHGTDRDSTTITTALGILGTVNARALYLEAGQWDINANVTVPSNITLVFEEGAVLDTSSGKTITINGGIVASPHQQIFGSSITVSGLDTIWVDWFPTISAAFGAIDASHKTINFLPKDTYTTTTSCNVDYSFTTINLNNCKITASTDITIFNLNASAAADASHTINHVTLNGPGWLYNSSGASTKAAVIARDIHWNYIRGGIYFDSWYYGIQAGIRDYVTFSDNQFFNCVKGIYLETYLSSNTPQIVELSRNSFSYNDNGTHGISIETDFNDITIRGGGHGGFNENGIGIYVSTGVTTSSRKLTIDDVSFEHGDDTPAGVKYLYIENTDGQKLQTVRISGNHFSDAAPAAITIEKSDDGSIFSNDFGMNTGIPIAIDSDSDNWNIFSNRISDAGYALIDLATNGVTNCWLTHNGVRHFFSGGSELAAERPILRDMTAHVTSGTDETDFSNYTLPGLYMGEKGVYHIHLEGSQTNGAGEEKAVYYRFGSKILTLWSTGAGSGSANDWWSDIIIANTAVAVQVISYTSWDGQNITSNADDSAAINTATVKTVRSTGQVGGTGTDTITQTMNISRLE